MRPQDPNRNASPAAPTKDIRVPMIDQIADVDRLELPPIVYDFGVAGKVYVTLFRSKTILKFDGASPEEKPIIPLVTTQDPGLGIPTVGGSPPSFSIVAMGYVGTGCADLTSPVGQLSYSVPSPGPMFEAFRHVLPAGTPAGAVDTIPAGGVRDHKVGIRFVRMNVHFPAFGSTPAFTRCYTWKKITSAAPADFFLPQVNYSLS